MHLSARSVEAGRLLWRRSVMLASVAQVLGAECTELCPEQAFLCGLLHEVGKLYMLTKAADHPGVRFDLLARSDAPDTWHPQVGRCIVENWGFDTTVARSLEPVTQQGLNITHAGSGSPPVGRSLREQDIRRRAE